MMANLDKERCIKCSLCVQVFGSNEYVCLHDYKYKGYVVRVDPESKECWIRKIARGA